MAAEAEQRLGLVEAAGAFLLQVRNVQGPRQSQPWVAAMPRRLRVPYGGQRVERHFRGEVSP